MSACVPDKVRVFVPLAPALMVAAPDNVTVSVPLVTANCTVLKLPSASVTEMPPIASAVSSFTVCAPGTVFTGASFTAPTVIPTVSTSVALLASVSWVKTPRARRALGVGFLWGLAVLTRPTALPLPFVVAVWVWVPLGFMLSPRERLRQLALVFTGVLLVIAPWTIRNAVTLHAFVPVTTGGGRSLLDSNNALVWTDPALKGGAIAVLSTEPWATRFAGLSEVELDHKAGLEAGAFLREHWREWPGAALAKVGRLWRWNATAANTGDWFTGRQGLSGLLKAIDPLVIWSLLMWPLALWGVWRTWRGTRRYFQLLPLHVVAMVTLGTMVYWGALRLRVPVEPMVLLYAAAGIADLFWRARAKRAGLALISTTPKR